MFRNNPNNIFIPTDEKCKFVFETLLKNEIESDYVNGRNNAIPYIVHSVRKHEMIISTLTCHVITLTKQLNKLSYASAKA